jgi:hypothetical protein
MAGELTNPSYFRSRKQISGSTILAKRFVSPGVGEGEVLLPAAVTTDSAGVTTEDIPDQATGSVQVDGIAVVTCSAAVAANARVQSGTDGRAATAVTASQIRGRAINATTASGQDLYVELWKGRFIEP